MQPQVSIITPFLNSEEFLAEAIESVLEQEGQVSWELLLINDGSLDSSPKIASDFAARYPARIRLLSHEDGQNHGASASRNLALSQARAPLLAFLDSDDVWLPPMLRTQIAVLQSQPDVAMVYANAERWLDFSLPYDPAIGSQGTNFLPPLIPTHAEPGLILPPHLLEWFRADESMTPCTCTVLIRAEVALKWGGFVDSFRGLFDDQVFYAKVALAEKIWVNLDCLARYRKHCQSTCAQAERDAAVERQQRQRFERWLAEYLIA